MDRIGTRDRRRRGRETGTGRGRDRLRPTVPALEGRALLSTLTVSNPDDSGPGSLRAAVAQANADGGGDAIVFSLFNTPQTIILTGGQLELTGTKAGTTSTGPGANLLSVSGNNASRVFQVDANVTATISGLTIIGGNAGQDFGGGLYNRGTLSMTDCTVSGNSTSTVGGGLCNQPPTSAANRGKVIPTSVPSRARTSPSRPSPTAHRSRPRMKAFAHPLSVTVTAVNPVEPVDGGVVSFAAPSAGASAILSAATAFIVNGQAGVKPTAAVTATANNTLGAYTVTATAAGAGPANFALANTEAQSLMVTTGEDVVDNSDGLTSLREAIAYAGSHPGPDTISFHPAVLGPRPATIRLAGGPLVLADEAATMIVGPAARRLAIKGDGTSRVFDIRGGSLALSRLTISGGRADDGGGIRNDGGRLALTGVILRGNSARILGGGLFNDGTATLRDVIVTGNAASVGGGIANFGPLSLADVALRGNRARFARALFNGRAARPIS